MGLIPSALARQSLLAIAAIASGACDPGSFQGEIAPCVCESEGCSQAACPLTITLDETCVGEMSFAEVLVGDHIEEARLIPLEPLRLCSRVEPGDQVLMWVRGGPWVWGPLVERCDTPAAMQAIVLQCVEAR
jgi:hypothetical protein